MQIKLKGREIKRTFPVSKIIQFLTQAKNVPVYNMTHNLFTDNLTAKHTVIMQHDKSTFVETELFTSQEVKSGAWHRVSFYCTHTKPIRLFWDILTFGCNYVCLMNKTYRHELLLKRRITVCQDTTPCSHRYQRLGAIGYLSPPPKRTISTVQITLSFYFLA